MSDAIKTAKAQADKMSARLKQLGVDIKRTHCLEAIAAINNYPDWNRYNAAMASGAVTPLVIAPELPIERYIIGGMKDVLWSTYARKVFFDAAFGGRQPVYVELQSGGSKPLKIPADLKVSKIEVRFDWDGNFASTKGAISNPNLALMAMDGPLHISVEYDERPERAAHKSEAASPRHSLSREDRKAERERFFNALAKVLTEVASFLAVYCRSHPSPLVVIDDSRRANGYTCISRLVGPEIHKDKLQVIDRLMGAAPSVLFMHSDVDGHLAGSRLGIKTFDADDMPPSSASDSVLLASIKAAFPPVKAGPEMDARRLDVDYFFTICELAGIGFINQQDLTDHLMAPQDWGAEFTRLLAADDDLVAVDNSKMADAFLAIGKDMKINDVIVRDVATALGEWVQPAIEKMKARLK